MLFGNDHWINQKIRVHFPRLPHTSGFTLSYHLILTRPLSLYVKWKQGHLPPTRAGRMPRICVLWTNHPIFKCLSSVYIYTSCSCLFPFSKTSLTMLLFLSSCISSPLPTRVIYYLSVHLFQGLLWAALLGAWIKNSPLGIPKWWQVNSDGDNIFWASDTSFVIFLTFLSYSRR